MRKYLLWALLLTLVVVPSVAAQDGAKAMLEDSPRHQEWVSIPQGERAVQAFLVYPEVKDTALAVLIIHENRGLTDWVRSVADRVAEAGYLAIAPDLLSGMGPNGGKTNAFADSDAAKEALYQLPKEQILADLDAVADYVAQLAAANGKLAVAGFCWGGSQSFLFATHRPDLQGAFVFYGTGPEAPEAIAQITAPVYGFYGGDDARVNKTVPISAGLMQDAGKTYAPLTYDGAQHAYMRRAEEAEASEVNIQAKEQSWSRWLELLKAM